MKLEFLKDAGGLLSTAGTMGLHLVSGTFVGFAIGWLLDRWLGTGPWLLLIFLILGIVAGFMNVYRDAQRMQENERREREGGGERKP
ncbi:AtpZ/AtpI family protein [Desulfovibrio aminophilus]|uniref:AtpZ/AtpI family protein n=1 Tax=Desulfovibrio aminophilus TaxID=81425 RepID=UPI0033979927